MRTRRKVRIGLGACLVLALLIIAVRFGVGLSAWNAQPSANRGTASSVSSFAGLLALPASNLEDLDIAKMNLLCARGLPGTDDLDLNVSLAMLDQMASRVRTKTERHFYRFQRNPTEFEKSEGFFKMLMLAVVLAEDFQVHYAPGKTGGAAEARMEDGFFGDGPYVYWQRGDRGDFSDPNAGFTVVDGPPQTWQVGFNNSWPSYTMDTCYKCSNPSGQ